MSNWWHFLGGNIFLFSLTVPPQSFRSEQRFEIKTSDVIFTFYFKWKKRRMSTRGQISTQHWSYVCCGKTHLLLPPQCYPIFLNLAMFVFVLGQQPLPVLVHQALPLCSKSRDYFPVKISEGLNMDGFL